MIIDPTPKNMNRKSILFLGSVPVALIIVFVALSFETNYRMSDLVERNGLYFKKRSDVPFSGKIKSKNDEGRIKNGLKDGYWISYHENGQLKEKGSYNYGKEHGPWERYWPNGNLFEQGAYVNGLEEGRWWTYMRDGSVEESRSYVDTKKDGVWFKCRYKFDPKHPEFGYYGYLVHESSWSNGVQEGHFIDIEGFEGSRAVSGYYKNGLRDGEWEWGYPDRRIDETYENGELRDRDVLRNPRLRSYTEWRSDFPDYKYCNRPIGSKFGLND